MASKEDDAFDKAFDGFEPPFTLPPPAPTLKPPPQEIPTSLADFGEEAIDEWPGPKAPDEAEVREMTVDVVDAIAAADFAGTVNPMLDLFEGLALRQFLDIGVPPTLYATDPTIAGNRKAQAAASAYGGRHRVDLSILALARQCPDLVDDPKSVQAVLELVNRAIFFGMSIPGLGDLHERLEAAQTEVEMVAEDRRRAAERSAEEKRKLVDETYGARAAEIAKEYREAHPNCSRGALARHVRAVWQAKGTKFSLPDTDRALEDTLKRHKL